MVRSAPKSCPIRSRCWPGAETYRSSKQPAGNLSITRNQLGFWNIAIRAGLPRTIAIGASYPCNEPQEAAELRGMNKDLAEKNFLKLSFDEIA